MTKEVENMLVELTTELGPFKTFVKNTLENSEPEPFCPFKFSGYCNDSHSDICYRCVHSVKDYLRLDDTV